MSERPCPPPEPESDVCSRPMPPLRGGRLALALVLLAGLLGCTSSDEKGVFDLARHAASADFRSPTFASVRFGTQQGWAFERGGILTGIGDPVNPYAVAERRAAFVPHRGRVGPQRALVDVAVPDGLDGQSCRLEYRGRPIPLDLTGGRQQRFVSLPDTKNRIRLVCDKALFDPASRPLERALHLYGFHLFAADDPVLPALSAAPVTPLAVELSGGRGRIRHLAPSSLTFALAPAGETRLSFAPRAEGAELRLSVRFAAAGTPRELWRDVLASGASAAAVSLSLPPHDAPALVTLRVDALDPSRVGRAVWIAPRIASAGPRAADQGSPPRTQAAQTAQTARTVDHVLLVVFDAARASSFSPYGYARETTPQASRLAAEGVLFEAAFSPAVFTRGAIASLWTSRWYDEHHRGLPLSARLSEDYTTLGTILGHHGVYTLAITANGNAGSGFGLNRGFAQFIGLRGSDPPNADSFPRVLRRLLPRLRRTNRSFIYLHFREPHSPYRPPAPYNTLFGPDWPLVDIDGWAKRVRNRQEVPTDAEIAQLRRLYDGNLAYADANLGAVRQALEEVGLWQRSAVILTADHGEALLEQGFLGHNDALYDACMRIPLIIRVPGGAHGRRVQGLVDLLDLAPTILELMGVPAADSGMRGVSLTPALGGREFPGKEYVFSRTTSRHADYAVRDAHWKYVLESRFGAEHLFALDGRLVERPVEHPDPIRLAYYRQILARRMLSLVRPDLPRLRPSHLSAEQQEQLRQLGYVE